MKEYLNENYYFKLNKIDSWSSSFFCIFIYIYLRQCTRHYNRMRWSNLPPSLCLWRYFFIRTYAKSPMFYQNICRLFHPAFGSLSGAKFYVIFASLSFLAVRSCPNKDEKIPDS
jgi:hypothetical protein